MKPPIFAVSALSALLLAGAARADDAGNFVLRLGQDTTSVEQYTRSTNRLEVNQVGRSPRVLRRHFVYDYSGGAFTHLAVDVRAPGSATPMQTVEVTAEPDSLRVKIQGANGPSQTAALAAPRGTCVAVYSSPLTVYESEIMRMVGSGQDSSRLTLYLVGFPSTTWLSLHRLGGDSVEISTGNSDLSHARIDSQGHVLGLLPIAGTGKFSLERVASLDLDAMADAFAAREKAGTGLGVLSPRDSVKTTVAGAALWIDYGRPGKRGRPIFGNVVPLGAVWRAGANAATQFRTDKALDFGGTVVPAGFYSLWVVPEAGAWTLIFNSQTGQWGTMHDPARDVYKVAMKLSTLPEIVERFTIGVEPSAAGGTLNMDWDTTRASVGFAVKP
ncbi:MAG TPA: DUF2911 domain-containing protein [Candidatus Saccharimonadales bacterium]|nr:DUF2911 domain-containing protein [Candidatus Saccharimonadales bacterium]